MEPKNNKNHNTIENIKNVLIISNIIKNMISKEIRSKKKLHNLRNQILTKNNHLLVCYYMLKMNQLPQYFHLEMEEFHMIRGILKSHMHNRVSKFHNFGILSS